MRERHCCATCAHIVAERADGKTVFRCGRLGYVTQPAYRFDCWRERPIGTPMARTEAHREADKR